MNNKVKILPLKGIGKVTFGMTKEEVHTALGVSGKGFMKNSSDVNKSEEYNDLGFFIYYDESNKVAAIEAWSTCVLFYKNKNLFILKSSELVDLLKQNDPNIKILSDGVMSEKLGITTWYENDMLIDSICNSITVFKKGYL